MQVEVSDWARERIAEMVADGRVKDEREAVDCAFAFWEAADSQAEQLLEGRSEEWWAELNESLSASVAELDAGKGIPLTRDVIEDIKRQGRERLATRSHRPA